MHSMRFIEFPRKLIKISNISWQLEKLCILFGTGGLVQCITFGKGWKVGA